MSQLTESQPNEMPARDIPLILEAVFEGAKRRDEFEYCRALLRERSTTGELVDPLFESRRFIHQYITLLEAPIEESLKLRLMLTLYCHTIEMRDLYGLVANLLRVTSGFPYIEDPFAHDPCGNAIHAKTIEEKVSRIVEWSTVAGVEDIGELLTDILVPEVRVAFSESIYSLDEASFYYRPQDGRSAEKCKVSLEWLLPRVNRGVSVVLTFIDTTQRHLLTYASNRFLTINGQSGNRAQVELLARPSLGLYGYRVLPEETIADTPGGPVTTELKTS